MASWRSRRADSTPLSATNFKRYQSSGCPGSGRLRMVGGPSRHAAWSMVCCLARRASKPCDEWLPAEQEYDEMSVRHVCDRRELSIATSCFYDARARRRSLQGLAFLEE